MFWNLAVEGYSRLGFHIWIRHRRRPIAVRLQKPNRAPRIVLDELPVLQRVRHFARPEHLSVLQVITVVDPLLKLIMVRSVPNEDQMLSRLGIELSYDCGPLCRPRISG